MMVGCCTITGGSRLLIVGHAAIGEGNIEKEAGNRTTGGAKRRTARMVKVGQWVRRIRRERELSQAALAARAGMAKNSINKIELGHMNPSSESVVRIAEALDVPVAALYAEEPELALPKASAPPSEATTGQKPDPQNVGVARGDEGDEGFRVHLSYDFNSAAKRIFDENELDLVVREARASGLRDDKITEELQQRLQQRVAEVAAL
jgi:transcriptional regulator with XRE-family HTH domain